MMLAGIDAGNNTVILSMEGTVGGKSIVIPTLSTPYIDNSFAKGEKKEELQYDMDVDITLNHDRGDGEKRNLGRHFVGKTAPIVNKNVDLRPNAQKKLGDDALMICILSTLAYGAIKMQDKKKGSIVADFNIVTGLPYLQYKSDREDFNKQLRGNHLVKFVGDHNITVEVRINECQTECEGLRAMQSLLFNEDGKFKYKPEEMVDKFVIGLDVGEFTTEMIIGTFSETDDGKVDFRFSGPLCTGWEIGITNAKQMLIDQLNKDFSTTINRYTIDSVLQSKIAKGKISLGNGSEYNITNSYKSHLETVARTISKNVTNTLVTQGVKGNVLEIGLMGGGPKVLDNFFGSIIKDCLSESLSVKEEKIIIPVNALTMNAETYYDTACAIWGEE